MRLRTQLIIEDTVMHRIDEIAGERHLRAKVVDQALREYIERYDAKPKRKVKEPTDPKAKAKAAAVAKVKATAAAPKAARGKAAKAVPAAAKAKTGARARA